MNEPTEITELEDLLQECRSLYANLSERNAQVVGGWPKISDPINLFPGESEKHAETLDKLGKEQIPGPNDFGTTLINLQKQFLYTWRGLLKSNLEIESLTKNRAREQSEIARLSEQVMLLSQSRAEASEEKGRLKRELELLRVESMEAKATSERLEDQLGLRDRDLNALAAELAEREQNQVQIAENEKKLGEDIENLERIREELGSRLEELERELETLRGKVEPVEKQLAQARDRVSELESELHFTREETVPKHKLEELEASLKSSNSEKGSLEESIRSLQENLQEKESSIEALSNENKNKDESLKALERKTKDLEKDLSQKVSKIQELEEKASESVSGSIVAEIENRLTTTLTDLESYREQFQRLENENSELKKALYTSIEDRAVLEATSSKKETQPSSPPVESDLFVEAEELSDEESQAREDRVADMEVREIETLESPAEEVSSQVLTRDSDASGPKSETADELKLSELSGSSTGDPSFVTAEETAPAETSSTEESASEDDTRSVDKTHFFPYPEIDAEGLKELEGKQILLVGGDVRFRQDYEYLFQMGKAEMDYHPSIIHLEKKGMKNAVRDSNMVVAFGGATQEPGLFRLRKICTDYGRYLLEHPSSGLVSLSQKLKEAIKEI